MSLAILIAMAAAGVGLCMLVASPFLPGLVWALSLGVVGWPLHERVARWISKPSLAAGLSTCIVALVLLAPAAFLAWHVGSQISLRVQQAEQYVQSGQLDQLLQRFPRAAQVYETVSGGSGSGGGGGGSTSAAEVAAPVGRIAGAWLAAAGAAAIQIAIALFTLFFLFRDRAAVLRVLRGLMPMSNSETTYLFEQIRGMTRATIFGTVVVAAIQGGLGGVMFAILGIPGALLWGVAMAVLSIIPTAGAFLIWLPAAIALGAQGEVGRAAILAAWGLLAVSTIDNLLYPLLVGQEMRLHTLPVFLAIVGGVVIFGAAGVVLGPVILAATIALLNIAAARVQAGRPVPH